MTGVLENHLIDGWLKRFSRAPHLVSIPHESDAEVFELAPGEDPLLAATTDGIAEEIQLGFFEDPYTIGWMGVMANMSDLAAVGARPLGILLSITLPGRADPAYQDAMARGIEDACRTLGTFVLGGDSNQGDSCSITGCALGTVPRDQRMSRRGCQPGHRLFASGPLGAGNGLAASKVMQLGDAFFAEADYRPVARTREAALIARFASACMDTSDALVATLDQLQRVNHCGFRIETRLGAMLHPVLAARCQATGMHPFLFLAAHHGEFELVFAVPADRCQDFLGEASLAGFSPLALGEAIAEPVVCFGRNNPVAIDSERIRNLHQVLGGDLLAYVQEIVALAAAIPLDPW